MKAEILQRLRGSATVPSTDMPRDASDVDLSRQYLEDIESRSVSTFHSFIIIIIIIIIIHEFHRDAGLETKLQGRYVSRITLQL